MAFYIARFVKYDGDDYTPLVEEVKLEKQSHQPKERSNIRDASTEINHKRKNPNEIILYILLFRIPRNSEYYIARKYERNAKSSHISFQED